VELLAKVADAGSMLWQALDERERMLVAYAGAWVALALLAAAQRRSRENLRRSIIEELSPDGDRSRS
jgi:hypothetical protein